jgi:hypothetical protein
MSVLSLVLGPLGFGPGIVCGHLARRRIRRDPTLGGNLATAGLIAGYAFLAIFGAFAVYVAVVGAQAFKAFTSNPGPTAETRSSEATPVVGSNAGGLPAPEAPASAGVPEPWKIRMDDPTIPQQPVQGPIRGRQFLAKSARLEGQDLVLFGNGELRLKGKPESGGIVNFNLPEQLEGAARFSVATLLLDLGALEKSFQLLYKTENETVDLAPQAGIRLVFQAPRDGKCKGQLHLGWGEVTKDYVLGHFEAELSPELAARLEHVKPVVKVPDFKKQR